MLQQQKNRGQLDCMPSIFFAMQLLVTHGLDTLANQLTNVQKVPIISIGT